MKIKKAVFPVAGFGTRFLPATKSMPKEMLPIIDKPLVHYAVEEALHAGIKTIIFITGRGKRAIEDYFDYSYELEHTLKKDGKNDLYNQIREISELCEVIYVRQKEPLGLGHAILCANDVVGNEPFAVFLPDDIIFSKIPCIKQLIDVYEKYKTSVLAVREVSREKTKLYGIIKPEKKENSVYKVLDMIEKPEPKKAPSNLGIVGRYILTPEVFKFLEKSEKGTLDEIQITDSIKKLIPKQGVYACEFEGEHFDAGDKLGFLKATVSLALKRPDLKDDFKRFLDSVK
ncbi:MAG: UTP--glucose-1-phosphate uridylyltransferase GalU [Candidatus Aenigmarchaeota archaeon]|nr:UTP--glucose-1-phosphate uridylyltransferase GalU [Candidatus Aenigmarchaeota archaeon]